MISQYWLKQIPARPLSIQVKNQDGLEYDLSGYTDIKVVLLGSNNETINTTGAVVDTSNANIGKILFRWPTDRSLFDNSGDYVLQLELTGTGKKDFTSTHTIRVRELGRIR
jgi:hypothetical protein